ncbi:retrovirus-related pol polyprotein from transposon TNT 1-94 [Tanacetum coccineum]|uniref:Retrovirus-related pol polyprotein from transposon TNT 1-94 n=1 Tax=Tanacetum coccineum TaxID=301880 RepID=A0ABQ5CHQ0_9ASTR
MAAVEVLYEYMGGQLNVAPVLEVENFTNWKKRLLKKWLGFCQSLRNTNHVKDSKLASLFDSPDDKEDKKRSHEYLNDLEEEYKARALLAKSKRLFKKGTQRFSSAKASYQTKCHKCGKKGHFTRDCWSKALVPLYQSSFQLKPLSSSQHKPELRPTKDFEAKYNKFMAKLALLNEEEVSSDDNEMVEVKVLMALAEENDAVSKKGARNGEWVKISMRKCISKQIPSQKKRILGVDQLSEDPSSSGQKDLTFVKSLAEDTKVSIPGVERPWLSEAEGFILPNHNTGRILPAELQRNTTDPSVAVTDSSATKYDSTDEFSVCSTTLPPLKKLDGVEPVSGPKTIKSILKSKSTLKAEPLKGVKINEPSSAPAKGNKSSSPSKVNSAPAGKLKSVKIKDDPPLAIVMKELNDLKLQISKNQSSYFRKRPIQEILYMLSKDVKFMVAQLISTHTITNHYDIEWFIRGEALQAKKAKALKSNRAESSNANRSKTPTKRKPIWYLDSRCSRHMTGVKSNLHKYIEQPEPKFDKKSGTIFNSNKEIVMIVPRVRDVYVLDMTSSAQESCFFAKASDNLNWLLHKRPAHLNFKIINKLAKQILVVGFPSLVYSKDKPCSSCEKGKHHRASFKTKQTSSIKKCLHLLHVDLFRLVTPRSINHEKYTLIIVDEHSRTNNGTKFKNSILINFCDEKEISQNFSSPYTPEQNGVAKRKNKTLIEATRTMLSGSVFSKQYRTEAVATACYTQNRSTIVKRHLKTPYEIFHKRIPNINFLHLFRCPVYIHNHKDYLGKFDEKADDGYLLGYSLVSKAFRVVNTRRQQTEETYHITFDESPDAIKF